MLFVPIKFKTTVQLYPVEMDVNYQERLVEKIKNEYEGVCSKFGYIRPNSIEIIKRSCGLLQKAYFNGSIRFEMLCRAEVCNPIQGSMVEAIVKNKNQLGILAESYMDDQNNKLPILDIIIPVRSAGIISHINIDSIQIGDTINVEVLGKKYQMKDRKISIIGRAVISDIKKEPLIITEEEEVDPALEEEIYEDIDEAEIDSKKEGGADDEEEEEKDNSEEEEESDDDEPSSLEGGESDVYDELDDVDGDVDGGYEPPDD